MNENNPAQQYTLPTIVLGFGDIATINSIVRAYIPYARRTVPPSQQREIECHLLEGGTVRLAQMRPDAPEVSLVLSVSEMRVVNNALLSFAAFVRQKVPPSRERDETLQDTERFRLQLARLLPARPVQA